jgi:hypothetical protein
MSNRRIRCVAALALGLAAVSSAARAQQPQPFQYTDYANPKDNATDQFWRRYYGEEREVVLYQPSFTAHVGIQRDHSQQAFAIFYSPRVCSDLRTVNGATLSKCPARMARFFPSGSTPDVINLADDVCVVRIGDAPPPSRDFGWNGAQVTFRKIDGANVMILSAVLAGELVTECTTTIPLGASS